ncbi:MAG: DUF3105 domain-containing protein [Acidimicrobiales bacterium]
MRLLAALLLSTVVMTACGRGSDGSGCVEVREPLDPLSIQHVLDAEAAVFLTDPPTSGPHLSGPSVSGEFAAPVTPAAQVRVLEAGGVVVQYTDGVDVDPLRAIVDQTDLAAVLAPAEALPAPVVATAWTWKLTCDGPEVDRILDFAAARVNDAPGLD